MDLKKVYNEWLDSEYIDVLSKEELRKISDEKEIEDRFYQDLSFGTAGLRGKLGAGTNRMNIYTVGKATQALADVIKDYGKEACERGVVIAYDVRNYSKEFSKISSSILAENGIKVYLFEDIRPTPMLSFALRYLNCISGIVITASHNPKEYNGYKVYWEEGSQILNKHADAISEKINSFGIDYIKWGDFDSLVESGKIEIIGEKVDEAYYEKVLNKAIYDGDEVDKNINITYSPLNGTGYIPVTEILKRRGFNNVHIVEEQRDPDGDFKTVGYPNPEDIKAFDYSLKLAKEVDSDIIIATDPDADRVSMIAKDSKGEYFAFNGNQIGVLLINYILNGLSNTGKLPKNGAIVKSIVTGDMAKKIADEFNVEFFDVLTGFKNIAELPNKWEKSKEYEFIFGYEESIGFNFGDFVRDKDAVISSMMIAEMAGYYKNKGTTLVDVLNDLFEKYGYYKEDLISIVMEGASGQEKIERIMTEIRNNPFDEISSINVSEITDYKLDDTGLEKSNVLKYKLEDGSWFALRPSGTEPKIKLYIYSKSNSKKDSEEKVKKIKDYILDRIESID